ncbi:hypothetical protein [Curtobacterium sp. ISL-83]|uniref:hypothetical protein n=1 Tax=Curtobacterium sp. ISL-83 TaxID=2819145 RepID=UPI001BE5E2B7|nr:hypothetical protein [Curtobacterium sp. ISL-83]
MGRALACPAPGAVMTLGLGAVLSAAPTVGIVLRFVGAAVLVVLGVLAIVGRWRVIRGPARSSVRTGAWARRSRPRW